MSELRPVDQWTEDDWRLWGRSVRDRRQAAGWSLKELAGRAGVAVDSLRKSELHGGARRTITVARIERALEAAALDAARPEPDLREALRRISERQDELEERMNQADAEVKELLEQIEAVLVSIAAQLHRRPPSSRTRLGAWRSSP